MKHIYILFIFISSFCAAQNLNFTIDTAVDTGTSITETIVSGSDTYVLTVDHGQDVEELDDLGGGDLIFFLGSGNASTPFSLTITKNGAPTNFNLNSIDYDTLGAGSIGLVNQDDAEISPLTAYALGAGTLTITNASNALDISEIKITSGGGNTFNNFGFHNINVDILEACTPPAATVALGLQDCGAGTYEIDVTVTDLGNGSPVLFDGTFSYPVNVIGITTIGPFDVGTPATLTFQHGSDPSCDVALGTISDTCPPSCSPPAATAALGLQDCAAGTYEIDVTVTDLGSGSPVIFDGEFSYPVAALGITTIGPFDVGTPATLTFQHGSDTSCDVDLGTVGDTCSEVIFTIDDAVDNGATITETIIDGSDTYVLTVDHPGNENLDDLGGGDLIFFHSTGDPLTPYTLSITKNGVPTNFTLKGMDYDTLEAVDISLQNQDDEEISPITNYPIGAGAMDISNMANATDISSFKITPLGSDDLNDIGFHNIKVDIVPCAPPAATVALGLQDCAAGTYEVNVNVTDLGNGSPVLFDGAFSYPVTDIGITIIGPFNIGTPATITLQHGNDSTCDVDLGTIVSLACNDECTDAFPVNCGDTVAGSTVNATDSGNNASNDVFYTFSDTVDQLVTLSLCNSDYDTLIRVFDDCPQTNQITANDDSCGTQSEVTFLALANTTYYLMIEGFDDNNGNYEMAVSCAALAENDECTTAFPVACGDTVMGSTVNATDSGSNAANDVFYSFEGTVDQNVTLTLCNSDYDTFIRVFDDCPQTNEIAGNDDFCGTRSEVSFLAEANTIYYIMVEGFNANAGNYEMSVACEPIVPAPGNDECSNATALTLGTTLSGQTTAGATDDSMGETDDTVCEPTTFKSDVWYTFTAPVTGEVQVTTVISDTSDQANVAVYSSTDCSQLDTDSVGCSAGNGGESLDVSGLVPGAIYSVRVWSDGAEPTVRTEGGFSITVTEKTLSISQVNNDQLFNYYPNPVKNRLTIKAQNPMSKIRVFNMLGQTMLNESLNTTTKNLDLTQLNASAYFVEVTIASTTKIVRIIKE